MSSYKDSQQTELQGYQLITPYLEAVSYQGRYVIAKDGSENIIANQLRGQDIYIQLDDYHTISADMKAVEASYNRIFVESLSNKKTQKPGWMFTNQVDLILYVMLGSGELSAFHFPSLRQWCDGNIIENDYPYVPQKKCSQLNDSWGFLVPKWDLRELGAAYIEVNLADPDTYKLPKC